MIKDLAISLLGTFPKIFRKQISIAAIVTCAFVAFDIPAMDYFKSDQIILTHGSFSEKQKKEFRNQLKNKNQPHHPENFISEAPNEADFYSYDQAEAPKSAGHKYRNGKGNAHEEEKEQTRTSRKRKTEKNRTGGANKGIGVLGFVLILILASLVAVLLYFFVVKPSKKTLHSTNSGDDQNKGVNLAADELKLLLDRSISEKQFREAIRFYFLLRLKELNETGKIKWQKEKTNYHYIIELRQSPLLPQFKSLVIHYEKYWYGNYPLEERNFLKIEQDFKLFGK